MSVDLTSGIILLIGYHSEEKNVTKKWCASTIHSYMKDKTKANKLKGRHPIFEHESAGSNEG
jgi:hypothetical protein